MRHLDRGSLDAAVRRASRTCASAWRSTSSIVKMHLEAVREVSTIVADAIRDAESDGTYSVSVGRPAPRP